jgi:hypothetical protein
MAKRKSWMIPTPFVLNDAVIVRQKIKASAILENNNKPISNDLSLKRDSLSVAVDSIKR